MAIDIFTEEKPVNIQENSHLIRKVITDMLGFAEQLIVNSETSYKKLTSLYAQAREWKKSIEAKRKSLTEPFRKQTAVINDQAKELSDPLDQVIQIANIKTGAYQALLIKQKEEADAVLRAAAAMFDASEDLYIPPMENNLRGEGAIAITKTHKRFKVLDINKVPIKYLMVDEESILQDLKLGINEISGLEIWEETTTQLRVR